MIRGRTRRRTVARLEADQFPRSVARAGILAGFDNVPRHGVPRRDGPKATHMEDNGSIVGELVNLRQFKKRVAREESARQAETNRARFGRTKSERQRDEMRARRAADALDQHRLSDGGST